MHRRGESTPNGVDSHLPAPPSNVDEPRLQLLRAVAPEGSPFRETIVLPTAPSTRLISIDDLRPRPDVPVVVHEQARSDSSQLCQVGRAVVAISDQGRTRQSPFSHDCPPTSAYKSASYGRPVQRARFSVQTGVPVYFCDPRSPWQRGSNENTNGQLRQYFPKRTEIAHFTQDDLDDVAAELNDRPRQTLGWRSPSQALDEALR
jgi:hypothetical protein